jgi:hypothetical protein
VKEFFDGKEPSRGINPDEAVGKFITLFKRIRDVHVFSL